MSLDDTATILGVIPKLMAADSLTLTDNRTVNLLYEPHAADTITLTDIATVTGLNVPLTAEETVTLTDTATSQLSTTPVQAADLVTLSDTSALLRIDQFISVPISHVTVAVREMSVTAVMRTSIVTSVPVREMHIVATPERQSIALPERAMSVTAMIDLTSIVVPAREMDVAA
jgi:hypothetical protein